MQAFDHQAQHDLEHLGRAESSGASPSHHAAPSGPMQDATITPDNLSSALHVEDTSHPLILDVTSLSDAIQAPVSDLQPEVTRRGPLDDRRACRSGELRRSAG